MDEIWWRADIWISAVVAGLLNSAWSRSWILWPSWVVADDEARVLRPGLILGIVAAFAATVVAVATLSGAGVASAPASTSDQMRAAVGSFVVSTLVVRWIALESETRLLRAALTKAAAAPAADPGRVAILRTAPAHVALMTTVKLAPRRYTPPTPSSPSDH